MKQFVLELKKLFFLFLHDPKPLLAGIIAPTIMLIAFYLIFGNLASLPIAIVNHDRGQEGELLQQSVLEQISPLGNIPYFRLENIPETEVESSFLNQDIVAYLIIPDDFTERLVSAGNPTCTLRLNNYNTDFAKNIRLYLQEGILAFYQNRYDDVDIHITEIAYASQVEWIVIIASGSLLLAAILGSMFCFLYFLFQEKSKHTVILYQVSPGGAFPSFAARVLFALFIGFLALLVHVLLIRILLGVDFFSQLPRIAPELFFAACAYIGMACLFAIVMKDFYGAVMGAMLTAMIIWLVSGGISTGSRSEGLLYRITRIFPNTYALDNIRSELFSLPVQDERTGRLVLVLMSCIWIGLSIFVFSQYLTGRREFKR